MWRVENKEGGVGGAKCCRGVIGLRPLADKGCAREGGRGGAGSVRGVRGAGSIGAAGGPTRQEWVNTWSMSWADCRRSTRRDAQA